MLHRTMLAAALFFSASSFAQQCETVEQARQALVDQAALGSHPCSGNYSVEDFSELVAVEESDKVFCDFNGEDCDDPEIDFGMYWSFEPGARGWIGMTKACEFDYAITFID